MVKRISFNEIDAELILDSLEVYICKEDAEEEMWNIIERLRNFLERDNA